MKKLKPSKNASAANKPALIEKAAASAITPPAFDALMQRMGPLGDHLAVAVSGGADSTALALLAHEWTAANGKHITALTVDHGLRATSGSEAIEVGQWLSKRNIAHRILRWEGDKPVTRIQESARNARYQLMTDWCRANGALHLLLAHHQDDQAETLLMRMSRKSGPSGLAGMPTARFLNGVELLRPLLSVSKNQLIATLQSASQPWRHDPSNDSDRYTRNRIRKLLPDLASHGITGDYLLTLSQEMAELRVACEKAVFSAMAQHAVFSPQGYVTLKGEWRTLAKPVLMDMLSRLAMTISSSADIPRSEKLEHLYQSLVTQPFKNTSFNGCLFVPSMRTRHKGELTILREPAAIHDTRTLAAGETCRWDGRFQIKNLSSQSLLVRAATRNDHANPDALPAYIIQTLPYLAPLDGEALATHIGYGKTPLAMVRWLPSPKAAERVFFTGRDATEI